MNDTYVYRKHLRNPKIFLIYGNAFFVFFLGILIYGFATIENDGAIVDEGILFTVVASALSFFVIVFSAIMGVMIGRFRKISVTLTDQGIVYINKKNQQCIPYEAITKLEFPSIRYTGGWIKICYPNNSIRITVVLENVGDFLQKLKNQLDQRNMQYTYENKKFFSFYKTAVFADESWSRIYRNVKIMAITCIVTSLITTILLKQGYALEYGMKLVYASYIAPLLGYGLSEVFIGAKVKKRVNYNTYQIAQRDEASEKRIFLYCFSIFTILYIFLLAFSI